MTTLYVGNLPFNCNEECLKILLKENNICYKKVVVNRYGYGFVDFQDQSTADKAIDTLDGMSILILVLLFSLTSPFSYGCCCVHFTFRSVPYSVG